MRRRRRKNALHKAKKKFGKYPNTMLLIVSVALLMLFSDTAVVHTLIAQIGSFGYFGALITGVFSVSLFTAVPSYVVLINLAQDFSPLRIALFGAVGAVLGDFLLFRFIKDSLYREWRPWLARLSRSMAGRLLRSRSARWLSPVIGAILIASPLPDELGVGLMGFSRMKSWQFLLISFGLNAVGIYAVVEAARHLIA